MAPAAMLAGDDARILIAIRVDTMTTSQSGCPRLSGRDSGSGLLFWSGILWLALCCLLPSAVAQGVISEPPPNFETQASSHGLIRSSVPPLAQGVSNAPGIYQWEGLDFHPHLLYRVIYGDGIPTSPTNHAKTFIQEVSPGLLVLIGDNWSLDYTPTLQLYSDSKLQDFTDELITLNGHANYHDWGFQLSQTYSSSFSPLLETEALTKQEDYLTDLSASRVLNSQFSTQFGVSQSFRSTILGSLSQDIKEWTGHAGLNYQVWSGFSANLTGTYGYDLDQPGANMTFEQVQAAFTWAPGEKLSMTAGAGVEVRQLLGSELINPLFNGTITYKPWEHTVASLTASRTVSPSFFNNDVIVITTVSGSVSQRFLEHLTAEVSGGYTTTPFVGFAQIGEFTNFHQINAPNPTSVVQQNRSDITRYAMVRLSTEFRERGTISIFYSYNKTTSGLAAYDLTSTQLGLEIGWRY